MTGPVRPVRRTRPALDDGWETIGPATTAASDGWETVGPIRATPPVEVAPPRGTQQEVGAGVVGGIERAIGAVNPFQDELTGLVNALPGIASGKFKETYQRERDASRERQASFGAAHPVVATALDVAGGIAPALATGGASSLGAAGKVPMGLGRIEAFTKGAKSALPWAGGYSLGKAEGSPTEQALQVGAGTIAGGLLGGVAGGVGNWAANRFGYKAAATPDMAREFKFQGVDATSAARRAATMSPELAANTPAAVLADRPLAGALRTAMRADPTLARAAEAQVKTLQDIKNGVGDRITAYVMGSIDDGVPAPVFAADHPITQTILDGASKNRVFAQRVKQASEAVADRGRPVGPQEVTFKTVGDALAGGQPPEAIVAAANLNVAPQDLARWLQKNPNFLTARTPGLKGEVVQPYTLEFVRELEHLSQQQTKHSVSQALTNTAKSVLPESEANALVGTIKQVAYDAHPEYAALNRQYGEAANAQKTLQKMTGAVRGTRGNFHIPTGTEADAGMSVVEARALAGAMVPGTSPRYAAESGLMSLLRGGSKVATGERARAIGKGLLATGEKGQNWLETLGSIKPHNAAGFSGRAAGIASGYTAPTLWQLLAGQSSYPNSQ